jgi:hypothetical protein
VKPGPEFVRLVQRRDGEIDRIGLMIDRHA